MYLCHLHSGLQQALQSLPVGGLPLRGSCFGLATSSSLTRLHPHVLHGYILISYTATSSSLTRLHPHVLHGYILMSYMATSSSLTRLLLKMAEPEETPGGDGKHSSLILYTYSLFSGIFQVIWAQGNVTESLYFLLSSLEMWSKCTRSEKEATWI